LTVIKHNIIHVQSDTTVKYFIVILLLATGVGLNGHFQPNIYKRNLQMLLYRNVNLYGIQFKYINSLYNYYQLSDVLSAVSCAELVCCEYCECISRIFPLIANLKLLKIIKIINSFKIFSCVQDKFY